MAVRTARIGGVMVEQLTQQEKDEIFLDSCDAFLTTVITEEQFRADLARLGYNATEIEDLVKEYRPNTP